MSCLDVGITPWFYRTSAGTEIDLVIEKNRKRLIAIEIKRSLSPTLSKGFYLGCEDIGATQRFIAYPRNGRFPVAKNVDAIPLMELMFGLFEEVLGIHNGFIVG